jgi:hypothetical protein
MTKTIGTLALLVGGILAIILMANPASAQLLGANTLGDYGLQSGSQPPPGFWLAGVYFRYDGEKLIDRDGNEFLPEYPGELDVNGISLAGWYVTNKKIFGGLYGFQIAPAFADNSLESPILGLTNKTSMGFGDLYVQPINLGWHNPRSDVIAGLGVTMPTGRYSPDADDNLGSGMWTFELFAGTTLYFDEAQSWHFAAAGFFETHTEKKDTDQKVGNILTVEGGLGKALLGGGLNLGVSYYAQWKLSQDRLGQDIDDALAVAGLPTPAKHRGYGIGPEVIVAFANETKLIGTLSLRYFWETGVRTNVQGRTFMATATFPLPSMPLQ